MIHPAEVVNLIIVDEIEGKAWGPTVHDETTFKDAVDVLKKRRLWEKIPSSVQDYLEKGVKSKNLQNPSLEEFQSLKIHDIILGDNKIMCESAYEKAKELGLNSLILTTKFEGRVGK